MGFRPQNPPFNFSNDRVIDIAHLFFGTSGYKAALPGLVDRCGHASTCCYISALQNQKYAFGRDRGITRVAYEYESY